MIENVIVLSTDEAKNGFFPTPPAIVDKMLSGLDFHYIHSVLEPSAGKGDLIHGFMEKYNVMAGYSRQTVDIDACEIDPYLRQILKYNFSEEMEREVYDQARPLDQKAYSYLTESEKDKLNRLKSEIGIIRNADVHIVNDDFLTYRAYKHYDLILMNPPFSNGDKHLLKAINMQRRGGGIVICLLNAETIINPYSQSRQELKRQIEELGADVQFVQNAFSDAERKADVDVAIVKIVVPKPEKEESTYWERMQKAETVENYQDAEIHDLVAGDYIERAIQYYNTEVSATLQFVKEYYSLIPHIGRALNPESDFDKTPILSLRVGDDSYIRGFDLNKYMRKVRLKYWTALFTNKDFTGKLTSELQKKYSENVDRMADYEFSAFNIKQIMVEMNASISDGVKKAVLGLFEQFTCEHSWYPECAKNKHYFNGWQTNKAHKVGDKVIYPTYMFEYSYATGSTRFDKRAAYCVLSDFEKVLDYLGGKRPEGYDLSARLDNVGGCGARNVEFAYFKVDFYKKGTIHIKFLPEAIPLIDRLNIYAAQNKNWLPPNYGRTTYSNMEKAEQEVVDSFNGDGTDGSGEKKYSEILANSEFYLAEPAQKAVALLAEREGRR